MDETSTTSTKVVEKRTTPNGSDDLLHGVVEDLAALRVIVEGTAHSTGAEFLQTLVRHLAEAVGAHYAFVAEFASPEIRTRKRTIAFLGPETVLLRISECMLAGTLRQDVVHGKLCQSTSGVRQNFPEGQDSRSTWQLEASGSAAVRSGRQCSRLSRRLRRPFDARGAAQAAHFLNLRARCRCGASARPSPGLEGSRQRERLRDLYEEASICHVKEDLESRLISAANRAAQGNSGDQAGRGGRHRWGYRSSLTRPTPSRRVRRGVRVEWPRHGHSCCAVLEFRRKDNGKPVWVQWWSKPEPGGKYTRSMFLDITDHVLRWNRKRLASLPKMSTFRRRSNRFLTTSDEIGRRKLGSVGDARKGQSCRQDRCVRSHHRGDGNRQGTDRPRHPLGKSQAR